MQADFEHVERVIEVYSKTLLCEIRSKHLQERQESFFKQDWIKYAALI